VQFIQSSACSKEQQATILDRLPAKQKGSFTSAETDNKREAVKPHSSNRLLHLSEYAKGTIKSNGFIFLPFYGI
jgi:hypothetical protein